MILLLSLCSLCLKLIKQIEWLPTELKEKYNTVNANYCLYMDFGEMLMRVLEPHSFIEKDDCFVITYNNYKIQYSDWNCANYDLDYCILILVLDDLQQKNLE